MQWEVPGYERRTRIGRGAWGEVWLATDASTRQLVALRKLDTEDVVLEVGRRAALLRGIGSGHLVRVRVVGNPLVLDYAPGGSLASLLERRGQLSVGEVVTALGPLAVALSAAHDRGLAHGRISAKEVLLTADGKPLLDGLCLSFLYDAGSQPSDDVQALARLARQLLPDQVPPAVQSAIDAALEPGAGCSAAVFGQALLASCQAEPLAGLTVPDPPVLLSLPLMPPPAPTRSRRPLLLALAVGSALVAAVFLSFVRSVGEPAPAPTDWRLVLLRLDHARGAAFAAGDPSALARVYVPGSAALMADRQAMATLAEGRRSVSGLRHDLKSLRVGNEGPLRVELHVTEALAAHSLTDQTGAVIQRPTGPVVARVVVLRRTSGGWRVEQISA